MWRCMNSFINSILPFPRNPQTIVDMNTLYDIYCDESCHLEHDRQKTMVLGGIWCPHDKRKKIARKIKAIKIKHNLSPRYEIKWNKISKSKLNFYLDLVDFFFSNDDLHFRGLVIPDKSILKHKDFGQTHDEFYYKSYFSLLKTLFQPGDHYNIYLDIKDTRGEEKVRKLHECLCRNHYDFDREIIRRVQQVRSHELELVALADLFIGAMSYVHRNLCGSETKLAVIDRIKRKSGYSLLRSTLYREDKFNIFIWHQTK